MRDARGLWARSVLLAAALSVVPLSAQQPPPPPAPAEGEPAEAPEQPVFRAGINFVRVDVIATDRDGNPVTDLTPGDFEVFEDNAPQTIETFRLIQLDGQTVIPPTRRIVTRNDEETAAQQEDARIFVFFLDDYHVRLGSSMSARRHLVEFVQTRLGPNDLLAVMYPLSPLDTVVLTRDHQSVIRMLERFEGRKFDYKPRNSTEMQYQFYPAEAVERIRRQVSLSAIEGLTIRLGSLREGRKAIILVSEGYLTMLPPQLRDPNAGMPGVGNPARGNPFAGEGSLNEDRAQFAAGADLQQELRDVFDSANRNNTSIYAVDPRGLASGEFDISQNVGTQMSQTALNQTTDTLRVLADQTDGRAIVNMNDLGRGLAQVVRDSSAYYLLGYNSTGAPSDGKFHRIRVRVRRPGVEVRARRGYWALTAEETAAALAPAREGPAPEVMSALAELADHARPRPVRTWVGRTVGSDGHSEVTLVWEPVPPPPGVRREAASHVSVVASAADGTVVYRGRVPGEGETAASGPAGRPGAHVRFPAPPGRLQLRLSMEGEDGVIDSEDREMIVPDPTAPDVRIGTPQVHVARTVPEFRRIAGDPEAVPTASREFRRTERLLVRLEAAAPGGAAPTVVARLLNRAGDPMSELTVAAPADSGGPFSIDFPLSSIPPGEYLMEFAAGQDGLDTVKELIAFRVGS
ncbi:MAG: VWA domain-containing protein [Vicinamibacterales bacterium]|nr:VWA domain-containing protein [Vicinamibacterales bacterium]